MRMNIKVRQSVQEIVEQYYKHVRDPSFFPENPVETLFARLTATRMLDPNRENAEPDDIGLAENLIRRTSENEEDLERSRKMSEDITTWSELQVCSTYEAENSSYCEYKLRVITAEGEERTLHYHARFIIDEAGRCKFMDQELPPIRVIGDPVLQSPGKIFPEDPDEEQIQELQQQIEIAKKALIKTGGGGIAANQCAGIEVPYQFTIVGVYNDNKEHADRVKKRYPGVKFPDAEVIINPVVKESSFEKSTFCHGCLSIPGRMRGEIETPQAITVEYITILEGKIVPGVRTVEGMDAVTMQHELNHILYGEVYADVFLKALSNDDLQIFRDTLASERGRRNNEENIPADLNKTSAFYQIVNINGEGASQLDVAALETALRTTITDEALEGLMRRAALHAENRPSSNADTPTSM